MTKFLGNPTAKFLSSLKQILQLSNVQLPLQTNFDSHLKTGVSNMIERVYVVNSFGNSSVNSHDTSIVNTHVYSSGNFLGNQSNNSGVIPSSAQS